MNLIRHVSVAVRVLVLGLICFNSTWAATPVSTGPGGGSSASSRLLKEGARPSTLDLIHRVASPMSVLLATSTPAPAWNWANPKPKGSNFYAIVTHGSVTVAVGGGGAIYTSTGNSDLVAQSSGTPEPLYAVAYGNGLFVAVGGNSIILTSPDGITWTIAVAASQGDLNAIVYGGSLFVAVGSSKDYSSADGVTWTELTTLEAQVTSVLDGVAYGNGKYVAVDDTFTSGTSHILYSSDASTWIFSTMRRPPSDSYHFVTYGGNTAVFSVLGDNLSGTAPADLTSPDGVTWTVQSPTLDGSAMTNQDFLFPIPGNNEIADIIYDFSSRAGLLATSTNGYQWTTRSFAPLPTISEPIVGSLDWTGSGYLKAGIASAVFNSEWTDVSPV